MTAGSIVVGGNWALRMGKPTTSRRLLADLLSKAEEETALS